MGQRYDVIVTASESSGDYWMRAIPQESCSNNDNVDNILGIVRYDSSSTADPTTSAYDLATHATMRYLHSCAISCRRRI
jgi:hypothetical protein